MRRKSKIALLCVGGIVSLGSIAAFAPSIVSSTNTTATVMNAKNSVATLNGATSNAKTISISPRAALDLSKVTRNYSDDVITGQKEIRMYNPNETFAGNQLSIPSGQYYPSASSSEFMQAGSQDALNFMHTKFYQANGGWYVNFFNKPGKTYVDVCGGESNPETFGFRLYPDGNSQIVAQSGSTSVDVSQSYVNVSNGLFGTELTWNTSKTRALTNKKIEGVVKLRTRVIQTPAYSDPGNPLNYVTIYNYNNETGPDGANLGATNYSIAVRSNSATAGNTANNPYTIGGNHAGNYIEDAKIASNRVTGDTTTPLVTGFVNLGLYDDKIWLGINGSSGSLTLNDGINLTSVTVDEFINAITPENFQDYFKISLTNAPDAILNDGFTMNVARDDENNQVKVTMTLPKTFKPSNAISTEENNYGDLTDTDWIKDVAQTFTYNIPYTKFSQTQQTTAVKSRVDINTLNVTNLNSSIYSIDFIDDAQTQQSLISAINANPSLIANNLPSSSETGGNPFVKANSQTFSLGSSGDTVNVNLEILKRTITVGQTASYESVNFVLTGFNGNNTIIDSSAIAPDSIKNNISTEITTSQLQTALRNVNVLNTFVRNAPEKFMTTNTSPTDGLVVNNITSTNDVGGTLTANISFKNAKTNDANGYGTITKEITFTGFEQGIIEDDQTMLNQYIEINSIVGVTNLNSSMYSIDVVRSQNVNQDLLNYMNNNSTIFMINAPENTSSPLFRNVEVMLNPSNTSQIKVSVQYLARSINPGGQYLTGTFIIGGLKNVETHVKTQYVTGSGLTVNGLNQLPSVDWNDQTKQLIANEIKNNLSTIFENYPNAFLNDNASLNMNRIEKISASNATGTATIRVWLRSAFTPNIQDNYAEKSFDIKIAGFPLYDGVIQVKNTINISDIIAAAQSKGVMNANLLDGINNLYAVDAYNKILNSSQLQRVLIDTIDADPTVFFNNYVNPQGWNVVNSNSSLEINGPTDTIAEISITANCLINPFGATVNERYAEQTFVITGFKSQDTRPTRNVLLDESAMLQALGGIRNLNAISVTGAIKFIEKNPSLLINQINDAAVTYFNQDNICQELKEKIANRTVATGIAIPNTTSSGNVEVKSEGFGASATLVITLNDIPMMVNGLVVNQPIISTFSGFYYNPSNPGQNINPGEQVPPIVNDTIGGSSSNNGSNNNGNGSGTSGTQSSSTSDDLTWLWILIGCLLGGLVLAILIFLIWRLAKNSRGSDTYGYDDGGDYYDYF